MRDFDAHFNVVDQDAEIFTTLLQIQRGAHKFYPNVGAGINIAIGDHELFELRRRIVDLIALERFTTTRQEITANQTSDSLNVRIDGYYR